jgi:hypothetical protein
VLRKRLGDWLFSRSQAFRRRRMTAFLREFPLEPGMRVLDIGGTDLNWRIVGQPATVVLLNTEIPEGEYDLGLLGAEAGRAPDEQERASNVQ